MAERPSISEDEALRMVNDIVRPHARRILPDIRLSEDPPVDPHFENYDRGLTHYADLFERTALMSMLKFYLARRNLPPHPRMYSSIFEKIFWLKLLAPQPLPSPADKLRVGEWWYATIPPRIYFEEDVGSATGPNEFKFYVVKGRLRFVTSPVYDAANHPVANSIYDRSFGHLDQVSLNGRPNPPMDRPPDFDVMRDAAEAIGKRLDCVRVDYYNSILGRAYLGELTLAPYGGCLSTNQRSFEDQTGEGWDLSSCLA